MSQLAGIDIKEYNEREMLKAVSVMAVQYVDKEFLKDIRDGYFNNSVHHYVENEYEHIIEVNLNEYISNPLEQENNNDPKMLIRLESYIEKAQQMQADTLRLMIEH